MYDMGPVLDLVEGLLERVAADGEVLLDPSLDIFASIAEKQPRFRKWRAELLIDTVLALDGVTKHPWYTTVLKEAQTPTKEAQAPPGSPRTCPQMFHPGKTSMGRYGGTLTT